jgi:uncharacterized protein
MKKIMLLLISLCLVRALIAQGPSPGNTPFPKSISVTGSAEMEIVPDEIFVNIQLTEYQKRGESKKDLEAVKSQFLESCKSLGIPDSLISIIFYSGYNHNNYYMIRKKKPADLLADITYQVKFKNSKLMDDLVDKLDDNATRNFRIVSTSHSRISEFRKQLKIKAVQAAKEKGVYLTEAVGEKLGQTITIHEPTEWQRDLFNNSNYTLGYGLYDNERLDSVRTPNTPEVDFKKIKLRYEVNVVFALQ